MMEKEVLSAYLKVLLQHSFGKTDKKHEKYLRMGGKLAEI
jgi:hypothetical protein